MSDTTTSTGIAQAPGERAVPYHCPYCAEEDLRPVGATPGAWHCRTCTRMFSVKFLGMQTPDPHLAPHRRTDTRRPSDRRITMTALDTRLASPRLVAQGAAVMGRFTDPIDQARIALAWAHDTFGNDLVLASSMGDEVLVHLASDVIPEVNTLFIDTGYHFAETLGTAAAYDAVRPITLITVTPRQSVAEQDATEGPDLFARDPDRCCALRKVEPLERGLEPYSAWITGMRRADAPTRTDIEVIGWDAKRAKVKLNPLAAWTDEDVAVYAEVNDVLLNPLRQVGYASIGCAALHESHCPWRRSPSRPLVGPGQDGMRVAHMSTTILSPHHPTIALDHLSALESEAIHIMREVAGEFERPALLFSGGKDSVVMLHVAIKAFHPARVPFTLRARRHRTQLPGGPGVPRRHGRAHRHAPGGGPRAGLDRPRGAARATRRHAQPAADGPAARHHHASTASTPCSAVAGATRRRRGPRSASSACATSSASGTRDASAPSCGTSTTAGTPPASTSGCSRCRTGPRRDVWRYIDREGIDLPSDLLRPRPCGLPAQLHVAHRRRVGRAQGRRGRRGAPGPLPDGRGHVLHRGGGVRRHDRGRGDRRGDGQPAHRTGRDPRR